MTPEDIIRLAREAGFTGFDSQSERLHDFARLVAAAERDRMIADGWRQCAKGQRTTQWCAVAEQARAEEREVCARLCEDSIDLEPYPTLTEMATAIRVRSKT